MRFILSFFLLTLSLCATAKDFPFPCVPHAFEFKGDQLILNVHTPTPNAPQLFIFHNISEQDIWINHEDTNASASAGWDSALSPHHWTALFLTPKQKNFVFSCVPKQPGSNAALSCATTVEVCSPQNLKYPTDATGSWVAEDMPSLEKLILELRKRNFIVV